MCLLVVSSFVLYGCYMSLFCFFFFKQKTAYEMRISDWSSDVCSSDLIALAGALADAHPARRHGGDRIGQAAAPAVVEGRRGRHDDAAAQLFGGLIGGGAQLAQIDAELRVEGAQAEIGRAARRERVCQNV